MNKPLMDIPINDISPIAIAKAIEINEFKWRIVTLESLDSIIWISSFSTDIIMV